MHTRHIFGQRRKNPPLHRKAGSIVLCLMANLGLALSPASDYGAAVWTKTQAEVVWQTVKSIVGANDPMQGTNKTQPIKAPFISSIFLECLKTLFDEHC